MTMLQVNGGQLPPHVVPFCIVAAAVAACLPLAAFFLQRASLRLQLEEVQSGYAAQVRVSWSVDYTCSSHLGLLSGLTPIVRVSTQHHKVKVLILSLQNTSCYDTMEQNIAGGPAVAHCCAGAHTCRALWPLSHILKTVAVVCKLIFYCLETQEGT